MPGRNLVVVDHALRAARAARRIRPRAGIYVLVGLALSGWMGFLVLAGVLLATKSATVLVPELAPEAKTAEPAQKLATRLEIEPEPSSVSVTPTSVSVAAASASAADNPASVAPATVYVAPASAASASAGPVYELGAYEERRRFQERMRHADVADHEDGNVSASRSFYEYAAMKGWAQAALALAFTYDPHELQRRGVTIAADADKARACYAKARELMNATVAFYLSRLPPGVEERC
jgi:hypothetical protein